MRRKNQPYAACAARKHLLLFLLCAASLLLALCLGLSGCQGAPSDTTEKTDFTPAYVDLTGRAVWTDHGCYLAVDADCALLKADDIIRIKPHEASVDLEPIRNGDRITVRILTVQISDPPQTEVYEYQTLDHGSIADVSAAAMAKLETLGLEITGAAAGE